jgi:two-component system, chemotaxis family, protein-glutamate methylesterase/glutaminase
MLKVRTFYRMYQQSRQITEGLKCIRKKGGIVLVQQPSSAEVSYMPQQALREIKPDAVLSTEEIADYINAFK